jgi:hypothetical protein
MLSPKKEGRVMVANEAFLPSIKNKMKKKDNLAEGRKGFIYKLIFI